MRNHLKHFVRKNPEVDPFSDARREGAEIAVKIAHEGYRVWSSSPDGVESLTRLTDKPTGWNDWESSHEAPMRPFRDVDGSIKRLNVAVTINPFDTEQSEIRSLKVSLEQRDDTEGQPIFRPIVTASLSGEEGEVTLDQYGQEIYPHLDYAGTCELLTRGIDRAEIELHKRRPSMD